MGMMRFRFAHRVPAVLLVLLALFLAGAFSVAAQDDISDDEVNDVAADLYCPVCESTPLDVCPTQACADWRELIRTQLSEGASRQDVLDYFARQYGDGVLANPPNRGVSLIVLWIIPILGIALAAVLLARYMRSMRSAADAAPTIGPAVTVSSPSNMDAKPDKTRPADVTTKPAATGTGDPDLDAYMSQLEQELDD